MELPGLYSHDWTEASHSCFGRKLAQAILLFLSATYGQVVRVISKMEWPKKVQMGCIIV